MTDDPIDKMLIDGARDYNEPGAVPREAMWAKIVAGRTEARLASVDDESGGKRRELASAGRATSARGRVWLWPSVGIAAAAVLMAGILIGRRMERASPLQSVARTPSPSASTAVPSGPPRDPLIDSLRRETSATDRRVRELASAPPSPAGPLAPTGALSTADAGTTTSGPSAADDLSYRLVVLRHLAGSEAMITAFRSSARRGEVDAQLAGWSRDLLSTTRMLEASPVTQDPTMKRLLEDLDLVIAQISQYVTRGTNNPEDLDLIEQAIDKRGIINKLRGTLPVRNAPAGS